MHWTTVVCIGKEGEWVGVWQGLEGEELWGEFILPIVTCTWLCLQPSIKVQVNPAVVCKINCVITGKIRDMPFAHNFV